MSSSPVTIEFATEVAAGQVARTLRDEAFLGAFEVPTTPRLTLNLFSNPQGAALAALQDAAMPTVDVYSVLWLREAEGQANAFAASIGHVPGMTCTDAEGLLTFFRTVSLYDERWRQARESLLDAMAAGRFWSVPEFKQRSWAGKFMAPRAGGLRS